MAGEKKFELKQVEKDLTSAVNKAIALSADKDALLKAFRQKAVVVNADIEKLTAVRNALRSADPILKELAQNISVG